MNIMDIGPVLSAAAWGRTPAEVVQRLYTVHLQEDRLEAAAPEQGDFRVHGRSIHLRDFSNLAWARRS